MTCKENVIFCLILTFICKQAYANYCTSNTSTGAEDLTHNNFKYRDEETGVAVLMNHTDFKFDCCGFVSRWVFNAALNGSVDAMVWRKDTGTKYILVGSNTITSDKLEPQIQEEDIANGKRIRVNKDDLIGLHTNSSTFIILNNDNGNNGQGSTDKHKNTLTNIVTSMASPSPYEWSSANSSKAECAIQAITIPSQDPSLSGLTDVIKYNDEVFAGDLLSTFTATDGDLEDTNSLTITFNVTTSYFELQNTNEIRVKKAPPIGNYTLSVTVTDPCNKYGTSTTTIAVINRLPVINNLPSNVSISEDIPDNTLIFTINATDTVTDPLTCEKNGGGGIPFSVSAIPSTTTDYGVYLDSGVILNYDVNPSYTITVACNDGNDTVDGVLTIIIIPNQAPVINSLPDTVSFLEDANTNTLLHTINVTDFEGDVISCYLVPNSTIFNISSVQPLNNEYGIYLTGGTTLDYDTTSSYSFTVKCEDERRNDTGSFTVNLIRNTPPVINSLPYTESISEDLITYTLIHTLNITDVNAADIITCALNSHTTLFQLVSYGVFLIGGTTLNYDVTSTYQLDIECGDHRRNVTGVLTVDLIRNEPPTIVNLPMSSEIQESITADSLLYTVSVTDPTNDSVTCTFTTVTSTFFLQSGSSQFDTNIYVRGNEAFDYDALNRYTLGIECADQRRNDTSEFYVYLLRNMPPYFTNLQAKTTVSAQTVVTGQVIYTVLSVDPESDNVQYTMTSSSASAPFSINQNTGEISLSRSINTELSAGYELYINASDGRNNAAPRTLSVRITDINKPPVFLNPSQTVIVLEGINIGASILQPILTDDDVSDTHTFYASYSPPEGVIYFRVNATRKNNKRKKKGLWLHPPKRSKVSPLPQEIQNITTPAKKTSFTTPNKCHLTKAPKKATYNGSVGKNRRRLFTDSPEEKLSSDVQLILPSVLNNLNKGGYKEDFCLLLKGIASGKFPIHNIAFRLLLDIAKWYSLDNTTQMQYSSESMKFWKVVYRLFHGKALRFLSGEKSVGQVIDGSSLKGLYDPQKSKINFAVPNINSINNFQSVNINIPKEIFPGIITEAFKFLPRGKSYVLSVDGKKLAPGLNSKHGDQDLFGHEDRNSLQSLQKRLDTEIQKVESLINEWITMTNNDRKEKLFEIVRIVSLRIKDLRELFQNQNFALKKFYKEAGEDWRTSRYVYAISSIQALMFQIKSVLKRLLETNNMIFNEITILCQSSKSFLRGTNTDMYSQDNWVSLKEPEDLPGSIGDDLRFVKQRSPLWFENRNGFRLTGSKIFEGLGLDSLKNLQKHHDKVIRKKDVQENISEIVQERMDHGTKSEIHAIATLTSKVLPVYYPDMKYFEEGAFHIKHDGKPFILVSPDGSIGQLEVGTAHEQTVPVLSCEFKCPFPNENTIPVHYTIPTRYIPQILAEMASTHTETLLYICWTDDSTTVFRAKFDSDLWEMMKTEAISLYGQEAPKRPTRVSDNAKEIRDRMIEYKQTNVEFLCEIPSVKCTTNGISQTNTKTPYVFPVTIVNENAESESKVDMVLTETVSMIKEAYQICRRKATELLVWLLSDTDRIWHPEMPYAVPIAYAMKGYSLSTNVMRVMHDSILSKCADNGIDVVCSSFDGQWIKLATRTCEDKPLTLLQLQKDTWEKAKKATRENIFHAFGTTSMVNNVETNLVIKQNVTGSLTVSCPLHTKIMKAIRRHGKTTVMSEKNSQDCDTGKALEQSEKSDKLACLPEEVLDLFIENNDASTILSEIQEAPETATETNKQDKNPAMANNVLDLSCPSNTSGENQNLVQLEQDIELINIYLKIYEGFINHKKTVIQNKWKGKCLDDIQITVNDTNRLKKITHDEMNVIIDNTVLIQKKKGLSIKKSWLIMEKVNAISTLLGTGQQIVAEKTVKKIVTLKEIASRSLKAASRVNVKDVPKQLLNVLYATLIFPGEHQNWCSNSPFSKELFIENVGSTEIFSYPAYNDNREKMEPMCVDAHHLLVNLRVKVCKDGLRMIKKEAWHAVAENRDIISKSLVIDLIDKQNNAYALKTFSIEVETEMMKLGYHNEAEFCNTVRNWYEAEDSPGISASERALRRLRMKQLVLTGVDFGTYPPYGMFINGFSRVSFEGFLQKIDTNIQLYALCSTKTYNQRSISSLANETFFGELSQMEDTRLGCPKAISIPRLMSTITEILHYRSDPSDRSFSITSTRKCVYPVPSLLNDTTENNDILEENNDTLEESKPSLSDIQQEDGKIKIIQLKDHFFDSVLRKRKKQRQSKRSDISKLHEVTRGCLPVRQYHKCDESKILPTTRLGINLSGPTDAEN